MTVHLIYSEIKYILILRRIFTYSSDDLRTIFLSKSSLHISHLLVEDVCILALRDAITEVVDVARA